MTGGKVCSVAICKENSQKTKQRGENTMFFQFPADPNICKEWVRRCHRKDKFSVKNKRICSKHFVPQDYEDEIKAKIMGVQPKILKKTAIPSLLLLPTSKVSDMTKSSAKRTQRAALKERKELIEILLHDENIEEKNTPDEPLTQINDDLGDDRENTVQIGWEQQFNVVQEENNLLRTKNLELETQLKFCNAKIVELTQQLKQSQLSFEEKAKEKFKDFLSPNQVDIALKKKSKARWNKCELSKAFTLRYLGKRGYIYLRQSLKYPLPGLSTLQKWASSINMRAGILDDVLRVMDTAGKDKNEFQKTAVLSFDEVKVCSTYEYDKKFDEVVGPHSYMQIVMARGLFDKWKQPVYIAFDTKVTKVLLDDIITKLHNIKYNVVACVCDCGGGNQGLWRELGITIHKTNHLHPVTQEPVYFFADAPHLLKLLRNWFIDTGFLLKDGTMINKMPIKSLIESTNTEISSCFKLTDTHINCSKSERQNVRLAAQLFSNTTATALQQYKPGNKHLAENVGKFIQLVNNWFDVMNSYSPSASLITKKPYGLKLEEQNQILDDMKMNIEGLLCTGKTSVQVFQKGIIISIKSLQNLYKYCKDKTQATYILTHRLNQDCLENFFSQLRTRGGLHDHPSPLNALYRIRMILLGKNPGMVQTHANVDYQVEEESEYLLTAALKKANITNLTVEPPITIDDEESSCAAGDDSSASSSSTSSVRLHKNQKISERDGLLYIAGYLAKKNFQKFPDLGKYTYQGESLNIHSYCLPSWIQSLSFGGLIEPSKEWALQVNEMDKYFNKYHKDQFRPGKNIVRKTTNYILKKVSNNIPKELVFSFCRLRVLLRIKYLNKQKQIESLKKNYIKRSFPDGPQKSIKKMKKTVQ